MPELIVGDKAIEIDRSGFLVRGEDWDREVAEELARRVLQEPLSADHWRVIEFVRRYHQRHDVAPMIRAIAKRLGLRMQKLHELFPTGCRECMCLIAGLPQPTG